MKQCTVCKVEKQYKHFYIDKANSDGFSHRCSECWTHKNKSYWVNHTSIAVPREHVNEVKAFLNQLKNNK